MAENLCFVRFAGGSCVLVGLSLWLFMAVRQKNVTKIPNDCKEIPKKKIEKKKQAKNKPWNGGETKEEEMDKLMCGGFCFVPIKIITMATGGHH